MLMDLARVRRVMEARGLDVLVATMPENVTYVSGMLLLDDSIRERISMGVLFRDEQIEPGLVSPSIDLSYVKAMSSVKNVIGYKEFQTDDDKGFVHSCEEGAAQIIREAGYAAGRIGFEEKFLSVYNFERFKSYLPEATLVGQSEAFKEIRMVKTAEELRRMRRAYAITANLLGLMRREAREGMSEAELAIMMERSAIDQGAEGMEFCVVCGGQRTAFTHNVPGDYRFQKNDLVRADIGAIYQGYKGDLADTFCLGEPTPEQEMYFEVVLRSQRAAIHALKPGVTAGEVYAVSLAEGRKAIPDFRREHVGHGVGLEVHEEPILRKDSPVVLEPGTLFSVEVGRYMPGLYGIQIEDAAVVTEDGFDWFTADVKRGIRR